MLSRVANSAYWMSRYACRVENMARFFSVFSNMSLEETDTTDNIWEFLLHSMGNIDSFSAKYSTHPISQNDVLFFLAFDLDNPNSMLSCLGYIKDNAKQIREKISSEMWLSMNDLYLYVSNLAQQNSFSIKDFEFIRDKCLLYYCLLDSSITRKELWRFAKSGLCLEQADISARLLQAIFLKSNSNTDNPTQSKYWLTLLRSLDAYESYREDYMDINQQNSINYLLLGNTFPRSVKFCLSELQTHIHKLTLTPISSFEYPVEKKIGRLKTNLDYLEISELLAYGLDPYLEKLCLRIYECDQLIYETFFSKQQLSVTDIAVEFQNTKTTIEQ